MGVARLCIVCVKVLPDGGWQVTLVSQGAEWNKSVMSGISRVAEVVKLDSSAPLEQIRICWGEAWEWAFSVHTHGTMMIGGPGIY